MEIFEDIQTREFRLYSDEKELKLELLYSINGDSLYIDCIWVHPDYRKQGLASQTIAKVIRVHRKDFIEMACTNSSRRLWNKYGFRFKDGVSKIESYKFLALAKY